MNRLLYYFKGGIFLLYKLFLRCLNIPYTSVENSGDFALERVGDSLYVYLEHSSGAEDWQNNLDFVARPYKNMEGNWQAHGGFVNVWKSVEDYIAPEILNEKYRTITIVGYSHGAALAVLCHEYAFYHRPDIREHILGFGFGCPRVIFGRKSSEHERIWRNFTVIRNIDDMVTHLPPSILGFFHVGRMLEIGERGKYSRVDAHRPENILRELKIYEAKGGF